MIAAPPIGERIADWTVRGEAPSRSKSQARWTVECVCGAVEQRYAADIVAGRSSRCGGCARYHALLAMRKRARSGRCPVCKAWRNKPCRDVANMPFEWGVHAERARAAGCPRMPSVAELDAGADPLGERKERAA